MNDVPARFLLEENGFTGVCHHNTIEKQIDAFCDLVHGIRQVPREVERHSHLEYCQIAEGIKLTELMYGQSRNLLSRDTRQRLLMALNRCTHWDAECSLPSGDFK